MYKHIFFDLDGTLTDPFRGIVRAVQYSLERFGIKSELDDHRKFIGPPLFDSYKLYYGFSNDDANLAIKYYREVYNNGDWLYDGYVYDGIPGLLSELRERGSGLIIATCKPTPTAMRVLEHFDLTKYFDFIFGCTLDGSRLHKDEVIEFALSEHKIDKSSAVMVGDRRDDILGAHASSLPAIAVMWGYGSRAEFAENGADFVADDLDALRKLLLAE